MGYFGAIVRVLGRVVGDTGHDVPLGNSVAAQLVGHETTRFLSLTLQELSEESVLAPFTVDQAAVRCSCGHENVVSSVVPVSMSWTVTGMRTTATRMRKE